jgi:F420-dependent oxidoreductase-like protein
MKTAIGIGGPSYGPEWSWSDTVSFVCEAERLGVDQAWSAEAWGMDAVSPIAFLAARTSRIALGTGIMQITARVPAMTAMTALSLARLCNGRFMLGLGTSGPQVVEGLHGVSFAGALGKLRETVAIVRRACRGERLQYQGRHYRLPLPQSEGKALRLVHEPRPALSIYLATLAPRGLALTGELADGWLAASFAPEQAGVHLEHVAAGAARAGRSLAQLDLHAGGAVEFGDDLDRMVTVRKRGFAFMMGGMGSARTNFYAAAYRRSSDADDAAAVQRLWLAGKHEEAALRVPDRMVMQTNLLGTEAMVRDRIRAYRDAGITTLRLAPAGRTVQEKAETLSRALALVREVTTES